MQKISRWPVATDAADIVEALQRDGAVILENVCDGKRLQGELARYFDAVGASDGLFYGRNTRRIGALIEKSALCRELAMHPVVTQIAEAILKPFCDRIQLNLTQGIAIGPGEAPQVLHRDDQLFPFEKTVESMINVLWAVDNFTPENGGTRYILGSHKWDRAREPESGQTRGARFSSGSCLIYLGSLFHAGGANKTQAARRGAVISYNLGWLRQAENFYLSVPWERAQYYPEPLLRLMGYQLHRPNIGWVEGVDPLDWIKAGRPQICAAQDALTAEQQAISQHIADNPAAYDPYLS